MIETLALIVGYVILVFSAVATTVYIVGRLFEFIIKWTGYWPMLVKAFTMIIAEKQKQKNEAQNGQKDMRNL
jgi:hypothetical protein